MIAKLCKRVGGALACGIAMLSLARMASAQSEFNPAPGGPQTSGRAQLGSPADTDGDLRGRIERLEKQNEELMRALRNASSPVSTQAPATADGVAKDDVKKIVNDYLAEKDAAKKAEAAKNKPDSPEGYRIGSDLTMTGSWKDGVVFTTPQNDFSLHIGGWLQYDNVFWDQSSLLRLAPDGRPGAKQHVASGAALGGIGDLEDGTFFRRIRLQTDGKFWENYEYVLTLAFENDQFDTVGLDEFWVGATNIPVIGTARIGHVKNAIGLEADMTGSSKVMTFMERSSYSEAIELNQNFVTGLWLGNNYLDQRTTWSWVVFRPDQAAATGVYFGDGQYGWQGRLTALPIYECEGRELVHLGLSGGWRNGQSNNATSPLRTFQLRARTELRDDDPAGSPAGAQSIPNANSNRLIDTGVIAANQEWLMGTEFLAILGPFSLQAEYGFNWIDDAIGFAPSGLKLNPPTKGIQNYVFSGGYVQAAYTLTGENRAYDKRLGRLNSKYFGDVGPFTNAWFVRDENGRLSFGPGAWEIAARYSYTNLNDGVGLNRIQGGVMDGITVGLNWYLNANMKFQFDWVYNHRYEVPIGTIPGFTSGYGMRMQFNY
jgi:phosphate-selective porin OprO/OprP